MDEQGNIHRFTSSGVGTNEYHWSGSTADKKNPLRVDTDVLKAFGKKVKGIR